MTKPQEDQMADDPEVTALEAINAILQPFAHTTRRRILGYFTRRETDGDLAGQARRILEDVAKIDPKERFAEMVRSGLINEDGSYRGGSDE